MSEKAKQFLIDLSQDPLKMEDFWKNPEPFLASADLTAEEKEILRSGDSARIEALVGKGDKSLFMFQFHHRGGHGS